MFGEFEEYPNAVHLKFVAYYEQVNRELNWRKILPIFFRKGQLRKSGNGLYAICPFHPERTASLRFDLQKCIFHCFGCGTAGRYFEFICKMVGSSSCTDGKIEAMKFVKRHFGIPLPFTKKQWHVIREEMKKEKFLKQKMQLEKSEILELLKIDCKNWQEHDLAIELHIINGRLQEAYLDWLEEYAEDWCDF